MTQYFYLKSLVTFCERVYKVGRCQGSHLRFVTFLHYYTKGSTMNERTR